MSSANKWSFIYSPYQVDTKLHDKITFSRTWLRHVSWPRLHMTRWACISWLLAESWSCGTDIGADYGMDEKHPRDWKKLHHDCSSWNHASALRRSKRCRFIYSWKCSSKRVRITNKGTVDDCFRRPSKLAARRLIAFRHVLSPVATDIWAHIFTPPAMAMLASPNNNSAAVYKIIDYR